MQTISVTELHDLLEKNSVILIDVRQPEEHHVASILGAELIPLAEIPDVTLPDNDLKIVIQCASGRRSLQACQYLAARNPNREIYNLDGGIIAWQQAGLPIVTH